MRPREHVDGFARPLRSIDGAPHGLAALDGQAESPKCAFELTRCPEHGGISGAPDALGEVASGVADHHQLAGWRQRRSRSCKHAAQLQSGKLRIRDEHE